jgi:hypothetical protein
MVRMKAFTEVELYMDLDLPGVDATTGGHEVQACRPEILDALHQHLERGFGSGNYELVSFEFDAVRTETPAE